MANVYSYGNYGGGGYSRFSLFSPIIKSLMIINVVVYLLQHWFFGLLTMGGTPVEYHLMRYFALQPIESGTLYPWQFITYQFMHGGFFHLFFNMFALWMFGSELESVWGGRRFLAFYLISGVGAAALQLAMGYVLGSGAPTVGASGSIQGLLIAFGFMFPDRPIFIFPIPVPVPAKFFVLFWIGIDVLSGITGADRGVAHFAHIGGAICGYVLLRFGDALRIFEAIDRIVDVFAGKRRVLSSSRKIYDINSTGNSSYGRAEQSSTGSSSGWFSSEKKSYSNREITQEDVDAILDKIARSGYNSLSEEEKKILYDASKKL
jgi:membrane associated rhomboid family serine protease